MSTLADALAVLTLVVTVPLNWYVTGRLWRASKGAPAIRVLRERKFVALSLSLIVTVFALIFLNNDQTVPPLSTDVTKIVTRLAVFLSIIPALYWLRLYRRPR